MPRSQPPPGALAERPGAASAAAAAPIWDIIELLFFAYRDFVGDADEVLSKLGFGRAHHRVLHFVNRNPGMKVADLLDILNITKQSLGRVLKQLVDQGYVVQKEGAQDRRQRLLYVTPKGEALALKLAGLQTERINRAFGQLGPGAHEAARRFLIAMIDPDNCDGVLRLVDRADRAKPHRVMMMLPATLADDAPHLLVVDDDRRIRDLLSRFLAGEGYRVSTADTAADARAKLNSLSFDLLILDVMMPGESGFDFAKTLRGASSVPILMLTARDAAESRIKGLEMGADDYLSKPFEPRELSLRIANILKRAQPAVGYAGGIRAFRAVRLSSGARRIAQRRGGHPPDRSRARNAACSGGDARRDRVAHGARRHQ